MPLASHDEALEWFFCSFILDFAKIIQSYAEDQKEKSQRLPESII